MIMIIIIERKKKYVNISTFTGYGVFQTLAIKATVSFSSKLSGSTMFGATFNLVTRVGLPEFLEH